MGDTGQAMRDWFKKKLGNPIMPRKEKEAIGELEREEAGRYGYAKHEEEEAVREAQETGEDYPAEYHRDKNYR